MMRQPIRPFLTSDDSALDDHYREVLQTIAGTVNVDSVATNPRLMSDYKVLHSAGMVTLHTQPTDKPFWNQLEIRYTDKARELLNVAPKPVQRVVTGDMVTITDLRPHIGRSGFTRAYWQGLTDDKEYPIVHLYSEDWNALEKAGYSLPNWNDRAHVETNSDEMIDIVFNRTGFDTKGKSRRPVEASFPVEIEVILKPEQVNGHWRILQVIPPQRQWIRVSYLDLTAGDVIQNGTQGDYTILSIGEAYQGVRLSTVQDDDATESRPARFTSNGIYTLVKGALLDAARRDRTLVDDNGVWVGKGRKAG